VTADRDALREQLAAALAGVDCDPGLDSRDLDELADALLPVVDRIANERAAAELREAASDVDDGEFSDRWSSAQALRMRARADVLDPR